MAAIPYPFGLSSVLMTKTRTQGASFMQYQPRSGAAYTKNISGDNPVFFNVTFRFRQVDAQRFFAWFKGPLQEGRLPFTVPMLTEYGLANQDARFYAAQGDTILDHSQEGGVHTYTGTVFASSLAYPEGVEDNWDFVASTFWQYRGEWDLALNSMTPVAKFIELNFASRIYAKNEYMVNLGEVLSFSRASVGTDLVGGVLTDFSVNEARVGDGGLLVEVASKNEFKYSKGNGGLTKGIMASWGNSGAGLDGENDSLSVVGMRGIAYSSSGGAAYAPGLSSNAGESYTLSFDFFNSDSSAVDVQSRLSNPDSRLISTCHPLKWKEIKHTFVASGSSISFAIGTTNDLTLANGVISNIQLESYKFKTSRIKTNGSVETRQPDNATIDISDISEKAGSYLIEFSNDGIAYGRCIASAYIDNQNSINAYISQSGQVVMIATKYGFSQSVFVSGTPVVGDCRVGVSYSDTSATISVNGVSQSISGDWSNEMQVVALGMDDHGEMHINSHISYFKFNPESATESELNQWTGA